MLDQQRIPIGKLKQAYDLNAQEAEALLCALSPDGVFPYAVWHKAHSEFWKGPAVDKARWYKLASPPLFPETGEIPKNHFPTETYAIRIVNFLAEISKLIAVAMIEKGFEYVIAETYDGNAFTFKNDKDCLFYTLNAAEKSIRNTTQVAFKDRDYSVALPYFEFIAEFFPDTVPVDKTAAVLYLHSCGYSLRREIKGLSKAVVERILEPANIAGIAPPSRQLSTAAPETQTAAISAAQAQEQGIAAPSLTLVNIPASLWAGKPPEAAFKNLQGKFADAAIAYVLVEKMGCDKTKAGSFFYADDGEYKENRTYQRKIDALLKEAKQRYSFTFNEI